MRHFSASLLLLLVAMMATPLAAADKKPNFVIVVADDMGWSDMSWLGSRIQTPTLDALAQNGTFMADFYVAPTCSPTRAMLMTGVSNHAAGVGTMHHLHAENQKGHLEYGAQLHDGVVTIAEALKAQGYRTMMSGKWHLAIDNNQNPHKRGFDRSFGLVQGGASHFADQLKITPIEEVEYKEDGEFIDLAPDFYSTITYTDKLIEYIDEAGSQPFLAYLAFTAPHDPLQVPDDWLTRYDGVFDDGLEASRAEKRARLIELGLIPAEAQLPKAANAPAWLPTHKKPWDDRNAEEKADSTTRMEIYAGMMEILDKQMGRLIAHLEKTGKRDNTYIIFMSDNGAAVGTPLTYRGTSRAWVAEMFDLSVEQMGQAGSYTTMGMEWANISNMPHNYFKGLTGEGGVRSPLIISGPGVAKGAVQRTPSHVMDISPTLLALAGADPRTMALYDGKRQPEGRSLAPLWQGADSTVFDAERMLVTELFGNRMVRAGKWKARYIRAPFGPEKWQLFDISADPGTLNDVAAAYPEQMAAMAAAFDKFAAHNNVIEPNPRFSIETNRGFEGDCDWWCLTKYGAIDMMINPDLRRQTFSSILVLLVLGSAGGVLLWRRRRAQKRQIV